MLIIFGAMLFCEIIIINKCGFNNHTKYGFLETEELGRDSFTEEQENIIKIGCNNHTKNGFLETIELVRDTLNEEQENEAINEDNLEKTMD
jgi:hypothetical protein